MKRPVSLTILCIFSFIGGGSAILSNMMFSFFYWEMIQSFDTLPGNTIPTEQIEYLKSIPRIYFPLNFVLNIISVSGVFLMWKQINKGFHVYTIAQLAMIAVSMIVLGESFLSAGTFFTISFILLYAINMRLMNKREQI